jgi:hypothetical protein
MQDRISQDRRNLLHRTAGPYIGVIFDGPLASLIGAVCLNNRTRKAY